MRPVLSLDIETTGLDPWRDDIYMCGLFDGQNYWCVRDKIRFETLLVEAYQDWDITGHRTDFDIKFLQVKGWLPMDFNRKIHDSRIMGSLVRVQVPKSFLDNYELMRKEANKLLPKGEKHRKGSPLSLKVMAPWYLKVAPFWETPGDHNNEQYNEFDCRYAYYLNRLLGDKLQAEGAIDFYEKLLQWSVMLRQMEIKGIPISLAELDRIEHEHTQMRIELKNTLDSMWAPAHEEFYQTQLKELRARYDDMAAAQMIKGRDPTKVRPRYDAMYEKAKNKVEPKLSYSSPAQMTWLLKTHLGLNIVNPDGDESTGKAVLHRLAQERQDVKTYLKWRKADKVLTMYVPTYRNLAVDGIIHASFNSTGTRTGRLSCSGPNLQQVVPALQPIFQPPPGQVFLKEDLSGIEAALIALYSGDVRLYTILEQGESIHDHNVVALAPLFKIDVDGVPMSEISTKFEWARKIVKNIGFACFYGAGWRRIQQVFAAGGFIITDAEAKYGLKLLKKAYSKVFDFHGEITEVFEAGQTVQNLFGRPITIQPHENAYMQGFNRLIQSSASDLNIDACYKWWKAGHDPRILIHDCIFGVAPKDEAPKALEKLIDFMTSYKLESENGIIKLRTEGGISDNWEK